jgi:flagellum-specific peptidoglycan hydrolase FlgJ
MADPVAPFLWGAGGVRLTPEEVAAQRKYGQGLLSQGVDYSPIQSPWQGATRVAQALMGGWETGQADYAAKQNGAESASVIQALMGGAAPVAAAPAAAPMAATPMGATGIPAGKDEFVNSIMPMAQEAAAKTGLDPRLIVAQAALESGWGKSAPGNNLFGIKSHGMPGGNTLATTEVVNGQPVSVQDSFRAYASPADSVKGYADFMMQNPRYEPVRGAQGLEAQVAALGKSGYATDPAYADKVLQIASSLPAPAGGAPVPTAAARPAINPAIVQAISSPYMSDAAKKIGTMLFQNNMEQQQKAADPLRQLQIREAQSKLTPLAEPYRDSDGNLVQRDPMGKVNMLAPSKAEFKKIGTDPVTGQDVMGFVDAGGKKVEEYKSPAAVNAPASTLPPAPAGVDPKLWREGQSKSALANALPGSFDDTSKLRNEFTGLAGLQEHGSGRTRFISRCAMLPAATRKRLI